MAKYAKLLEAAAKLQRRAASALADGGAVDRAFAEAEAVRDEFDALRKDKDSTPTLRAAALFIARTADSQARSRRKQYQTMQAVADAITGAFSK